MGKQPEIEESEIRLKLILKRKTKVTMQNKPYIDEGFRHKGEEENSTTYTRMKRK